MNKTEIAKALIEMNKMATVQISLKNYKNAGQIYEKCSEYEVDLKLSEHAAKSRINAANAFLLADDIIASSSNIEKAMIISKSSNNIKGIAKCNDIFGMIYFKNKEYKKAISVFEKTLGKNRERGEDAITFYRLGSIYRILRNVRQSQDYLGKAVMLFEQIGDNQKYTEALMERAKLFTELKNKRFAYMDLKKCEMLTDKSSKLCRIIQKKLKEL